MSPNNAVHAPTQKMHQHRSIEQTLPILEGLMITILICVFTKLIVEEVIGRFLPCVKKFPLQVILFAVAMAFGFIDHALDIGGYRNIYADEMPIDVFQLILIPLMLADSTIFIHLSGLRQVAIPTFTLIVLGMVASSFIAAGLMYVFPTSFLANTQGFLGVWLIGSICATTDTAAILSILDSVGAPTALGDLVSGEALFNDAASLVMFKIGLELIKGTNMSGKDMCVLIARLVLGGIAAGLVLGAITVILVVWNKNQYILRICHLMGPFMVYYLAEFRLGVSGVLAVCFFGICMAFEGTGAESTKAMKMSKSTISFISQTLQGILFVWAGIETAELLMDVKPWEQPMRYLTFLVVYLILLVARGVSLLICHPLVNLSGFDFPLSWVGGMTWGALRGGMSLFMICSMSQQLRPVDENFVEFARFQITLVVLTTLTLNGPTLGRVLACFGVECQTGHKDIEVYQQSVQAIEASALRRSDIVED